jgi:hypothetical protein
MLLSHLPGVWHFMDLCFCVTSVCVTSGLTFGTYIPTNGHGIGRRFSLTSGQPAGREYLLYFIKYPAHDCCSDSALRRTFFWFALRDMGHGRPQGFCLLRLFFFSPLIVHEGPTIHRYHLHGLRRIFFPPQPNGHLFITEKVHSKRMFWGFVAFIYGSRAYTHLPLDIGHLVHLQRNGTWRL